MFTQNHSININGKLFSLDQCLVMGILNVTPDSFYEKSRNISPQAIEERVKEMMSQGVDIIDIGGMSTRPGSEEVSENEEWNRLNTGLEIVRNIAPDIPVSVDTYRANIAKKAVDKFSVGLINDISGGELDDEMFNTVAELNIPYIIMHMKGNPKNMQNRPITKDALTEVIQYFHEKLEKLKALGVHDVIIDPGFGFGKSIKANYELLNYLDRFQIFEKPILCGFSRKSMIYKHLNITPQESLNGTTILNTMALEKGCHILRVHDVKAAKEAVNLYYFTKNQMNLEY